MSKWPWVLPTSLAKIERDTHTEHQQTASVEKVYCVFSLWNTSMDKIEELLRKANSIHHTIKFTAVISNTEITLLNTKGYKDRFNNGEALRVLRTNYSHSMFDKNMRNFRKRLKTEHTQIALWKDSSLK